MEDESGILLFWSFIVPSTRAVLCVFLPHWSITRRFRRQPPLLGAPVGVIHAVGQRRSVAEASPQAAAQGVRVGMSAAEAGVLCPGLRCLAEDPAGDRRTLDALGRWLTRFTPVVARGWDDADPAPAALFLDLTGSERLFNGLDRLVDRVRDALAQFNIPARLALAPTPGAAWALASPWHGLPVRVSDFKAEKTCQVISTAEPSTGAGSLCPGEALASLPIEVLRVDGKILDNLHHLGLHRVGDVLALPRAQLPSRFGPMLLKRLDQLTGAVPEPLVNLVNEPPITARLDFDAPIDSLEDVWRIFEKLLGLVIGDLARRNHGVRQLRLLFKPERGWGLPMISRAVSLSRPHRDRPTLLNLIRCETERVDLGRGFVRFQLDVSLHEPITDVQAQLFDQQSAEEARELDRLVQRLRVRLRGATVTRPQLVESHVPERAWQAADDDAPAPPLVPSPARPLMLFPMPIEIRVVSEPTLGPPRQFTWRGKVHLLMHAVGPERISGEWWRGHRHTRDYFDAEDREGRRYWMFRVLHPRPAGAVGTRWFLHGESD